MPQKNTSAKKSSKKKFPKYASRFVGDILTEIIQAKMKKIDLKNPKATEKWLSKMRLSILRKVSVRSQIAFVEEAKNANIADKIAQMKTSIQDQIQNIREKCITSMKQSNRTYTPSIENTDGYTNGRFEAQTQKISDHFSELAKQIDFINREMESRIHALHNVVSAVEKDWREILHSNLQLSGYIQHTAGGDASQGNNIMPIKELNSILRST